MSEFFSPGWGQFVSGLLFSASWQAGVLVVFAFVASALSRRASLHCAIWTACIVALGCTPVASLVLPHCFIAYQGQLEPLHFPTMLVPSAATFPAARSGLSLLSSWPEMMCRVIVCIWLAGVIVGLTRLVVGWVGMLRLLRLTRPCRDSRVAQILQRVVDRADLVTVREMDGLIGALCWQVRRPIIILPAKTHRLTGLELEMMLRHEWGHLHRGDPGMLFMQRLVEVVYWFHPLVWWVTLQTAKYREFVCDDFVLAPGYDPRAYAVCLGQLAVGYYAPLPMAPAGLGMLWSQHLVLLRVKRLLEKSRAFGDLSGTQRTMLCCATAMLIFMSGMLRVDWASIGAGGSFRWTAWPHWTAEILDSFGIQARDYPLDAHLYDPQPRDAQQRTNPHRLE